MSKDKTGLSPETTIAIVGVLVLYPALGWLAFEAARRGGNEVAVWCASSIWMAMLLATPQQHWRPVLVCGVVASAGLMIWLAASFSRAAVFVLGDLAAISLTASLVVRQGLDRSRSMKLLATVAIASIAHALLLSPAGGWLITGFRDMGSYFAAWKLWISAGFAGALIAIPFITLYLQPPDHVTVSIRWRDRLVGFAFIALLIASSFNIARTGGIRWGLEPTMGWLTYTPIFCAVALSVVWPKLGSVAATTILASLELSFLFLGKQGLGPPSLSPDQAAQLRWYLAATAVLSSLTAALSIELRSLLDKIEEWKVRYESTLHSAKLLQFEFKLASMRISWAGDTGTLFGVPAGVISSMEMWTKIAHPGDRVKLAEFVKQIASGDDFPPAFRLRVLHSGGHYLPFTVRVTGVTVFEGLVDSARGTVQLAPGRKRGHLKLYRQQASSLTPHGSECVKRPAVMMIHGIGGSEHDFGPLYKTLGLNGFDPQPLTLPGHRTKPEDLLAIKTEDWIAAATKHYRSLQDRYEVVHIMGISLGALIALELAKSQNKLTGKLILISSPVFIDGWAVPWYYALRFPLYLLPMACRLIRVEEEEPFGVKDPHIRAILAEKFARGESYHYSYVPLGCVREIDRLRAQLRQKAGRVSCQTLIIHSREDDLTSSRSANWLQTHLGKERSDVVLLQNSYHMVCIDNDREFVGRTVLEFLERIEQGNAAPPSFNAGEARVANA